MAKHNLRTVIGFEVKRTLSKATFWITALVVPVLLVGAMAFSAFSSASATSEVVHQQNPAGEQSSTSGDASAGGNEADQESSEIKFVYTDASGLINPEIATSMNGTMITDSAKGLADVKAGLVDVLFTFPGDLVNEPVRIDGVNISLFGNFTYEGLANALLQSSLVTKVDNPKIAQLLIGEPTYNVTTYQDGKEASGLGAILPGLLFLAVFYLLIVTLSNQMLSSTLEEKENRVTEMILTTIDASSLLMGKIIGLTIIGITQMAVIIVPTLVVAWVFPEMVQLDFSLSDIQFDPQIIIVGSLMLICGFMLFTVSLVAVGAAMPTVKDAQGIFSVLLIAVMVPVFVFTQIMTSPDSLLVQAFTFFPYFAPMTGMMRNAAGSLPLWQAAISLVLMLVVTYLMFRLAIRLFRYGSVEYSKKIDIRSALHSK